MKTLYHQLFLAGGILVPDKTRTGPKLSGTKWDRGRDIFGLAALQPQHLSRFTKQKKTPAGFPVGVC